MFKKVLLLSLIISSTFTISIPAAAQEVSPALAPHWCEFAREYIEKIDGQPFTCQLARRCTKMNNYGCVKQSASPLPGTTWGVNRQGARDNRGHALFEHPKYSLIKMIALLARYQRSGLGSGLAIQERYAPWCDTLGSAQYNKGWGRSCRGEPRYPAAPVGYSPMCQRPANGVPLKGQCTACNCPSQASKRLVADTGVSETEPLRLFDAAGKAQPIMVTVLRNLARQEQGVVLSMKLTQESVDAYNDTNK